MKYIFFITLQFLVWQKIYAQVTGKIINADTQPVAAANVLLLSSTDTSLIKATLTKEDGSFFIENSAEGKYILRISSTGYKTTDSLLAFNEQQVSTISIMLTAVTKELDAVVVRAEKPLIKQTAEGLIVNAESSILTKGSNALQLLERSPGVTVNRRDNTIELNGKNGVLVMLNGKLIRMSETQLLDMLSGISADNIASIELLTSPSAKYDAEGGAGIVNIVLKKNKMKGTNGSVTLSAGYGYREKATAGFNLAHNTGKLNWYGSYTFSHINTYSDMYIDSRQNMPFLGGNIHALGWDTTYFTRTNHNATLGVDAILNKKTTIGGSVIYTNNKSTGTTWSHLLYNVLPDSVLKYDGRNKGEAKWNNIISSVHIERALRQNEKINTDFDYLYFRNNAPYKVQGTFVNKYGSAAGDNSALSAPQQSGFAATSIRVAVGKIDYSKQLNNKIKFEAGFKSNYTQSSSYSGFESLINGVWASNAQAVNNIKMKESINAAYITLNTNINATTTLSSGLRFEYANTSMNDSKAGTKIVNRKLASLFPAIFFTKKLQDNTSLQLSYTKRITRPSYNDLASYVDYSDPTAVYTGNTFLLPSISHNITIGYTYKKYSASLSYSRDENVISRYQLSESANHDMLIVSPQNISMQNNFIFQTTIPLTINNWWQMNYNFTGGWHKYRVDYAKYPFTNTYFGYHITYSQSFKLPHQYTAEISGNYKNAGYNGTQKVDGFFILNLGIKKTLKNNGGSFQLSVTDVLQQEKYNIHYGLLTVEPFHIQSHVIVKTETTRLPVIRLAFSKSFGSNASKTNKNTSSGDEQERIRKE